MKTDEKEFFREATLRICGSLDVQTFLYKSFLYLREYLPADRIVLTHYRPKEAEHVALASASAEGSSLLNIKVKIPPDIRAYMQRLEKETPVIDRAETHPTARPWISSGLLKKDASLLVLRLILGKDMIGGVIFTSEQSSVFTRKHADLVSQLREPFAIALSNSLTYQELLKLKELLVEDNRFLHSELRQIAGENIIGADFGLRRVMEMVRQVAPLSSPVLLFGETGTGKEVIAGAIHNLSTRKDGPLIKVNCGAIPENLMDSELFGHEKGAFTGALTKKRGRFERAHGGTIFLDEVGELHPEAQVKLLRVLQEKEIERVGGTEPIKVDIRVIAATHRDLKAMITEGTFRDDLYFRLNVFPITLPPLRERMGDIPSLVHYFIRKKSQEMGIREVPPMANSALDKIMTYSWPGNIRELENTVERALILSRGESITFGDLQAPISERIGVKPERTLEFSTENIFALDEIVSLHIRKVLKMTGGRIGGKAGAAELLHINPSTLRKRMRKLNIAFGRKAKSFD